jgi:hypothetical protein
MGRELGFLAAACLAAMVMAGPSALAQEEAVTPESLGIYRSSDQPDPLDRQYRDGRPLRVFDRDVTLSVQPPTVAERDYEGNERVRLSR